MVPLKIPAKPHKPPWSNFGNRVAFGGGIPGVVGPVGGRDAPAMNSRLDGVPLGAIGKRKLRKNPEKFENPRPNYDLFGPFEVGYFSGG